MGCAGAGGPRRRVNQWALFAAGLLLLSFVGWGLLHETYDSWHPCDWLLVDQVALILRREGIDPDAAPIPLKATVAESAEIRAVLRLRNTPAECLGTWAAGQVLP